MSAEKKQSLSIESLIVDAEVQPRASMSQDVVNEYAEALEDDPNCMPRIKVVKDGKNYYVWDGFHRYYAHKQVGFANIECDVTVGTKRDAILLGLGSNKSHGLKRSTADKQRAIKKMVTDDEWSKWSNREIARRLGVDDKTVAAQRAICGISADTVLVSRGDTTYEMDVSASVPTAGQTLVNGVLQDDPEEIAEQRAAGLIDEGVVPEINDADDEGETVESIAEDRAERAAIAEEELSDDEKWLRSLPLYDQLENTQKRTFLGDALFWRFMEKTLESASKKSSEGINRFCRARMGPYPALIRRTFMAPHPKAWVKCPSAKDGGCGGTGMTQLLNGPCGKCKGNGFIL